MIVFNSIIYLHNFSHKVEDSVHLLETSVKNLVQQKGGMVNDLIGSQETKQQDLNVSRVSGVTIAEVPKEIVQHFKNQGRVNGIAPHFTNSDTPEHESPPALPPLTSEGIQYIQKEPPTAPDITILLWSDTKFSKNVMSLKNTRCRSPEGAWCNLTQDRSLYNQSEAVVFHIESHPRKEDYPAYQLSFQKWVMIEDEAPPQTNISWPRKLTMDYIKHHFNITTTTSASSTVRLAAGYKLDLDPTLEKTLNEQNINYSANKTRYVAWFVSHCETQGHREDYVEELKKYIDIDVYGACGNFTCGKKFAYEECDMPVLSSTYKFYLSFESSLCEDYISEKLWRFIFRPITTIPIVFGLGKYKEIMPSETYLDVKDYGTPKDLADAIRKIGDDPEVFNHYVRKRLSYKMREAYDASYQRRLCGYLHKKRKELDIVPDLAEFWSIDTKCSKPWDYLPGDFWRKRPGE